MGIAEADGGESGALFTEGLLVLTQLRDVFAAEDSAVVAEEDEDGEPLAEGFGHDAP